MRSWVMSACVGALLLGLSACSEDEARPAEPTSSATAPRTSPSPLPPTAKNFSAQGVAAFAAHYVTVLDYAYRTQDVRPLEELSAPECDGCNRYIELLVSMRRNGGSTDGRRWSQSGSEVRFYPTPKNESFVTTVLSLSKGDVRMTASEAPTTYPKSADKVTFGARFDGSWTMTQFGLGAVS